MERIQKEAGESSSNDLPNVADKGLWNDIESMYPNKKDHRIEEETKDVIDERLQVEDDSMNQVSMINTCEDGGH